MRLTLPRRDSARNRGEPDRCDCSDIHRFVYKNDLGAVKTCLKASPTCVDVKDDKGMTPFIVAASLNRCDVMELLMTSSCDVMLTDNYGNTALHEAVDKGHADVVRKLVNKDSAIADVKNNRGETALMKAAFYDYAEIAAILILEGGASLDLKDSENHSALLIGLREGSHVTVDLLLTSGCDVTVINSMGQTALYIAIYSPCNRTLDLARKLITKGYDLTNDKMWLLNEEKHNLFYQDDDFYTILRRKLRNNSNDHSMVNNSAFHIWSQSLSEERPRIPSSSGPLSPKDSQRRSPLSPSSPPFAMSPTLRQKIMNPRTPCFPRAPLFRQRSVELTDAALRLTSPLRLSRQQSNLQKTSSTESDTSDSVFSSFEDDHLRLDSSTKDEGRSRRVRRVAQSEIKQTIEQKRNDEIIHELDKLGDDNATLPSKGSVQSNRKKTPTDHSYKDTRNSVWDSDLKRRTTSGEARKSLLQQPPPSVTYRRQISIQLPVKKKTHEAEQRKISMPDRPSVHFSTEIKVIDLGRIH